MEAIVYGIICLIHMHESGINLHLLFSIQSWSVHAVLIDSCHSKLIPWWCHYMGTLSACGVNPPVTLQWRHNERDGVSNHQPHGCLLNRLFRRRSKKTSKLRVTDLCAGNSPGTGEFPAQRARNAEIFSIWWLHYHQFNWQRPEMQHFDIFFTVSLQSGTAQFVWRYHHRIILLFQMGWIKQNFSTTCRQIRLTLPNLRWWLYHNHIRLEYQHFYLDILLMFHYAAI